MLIIKKIISSITGTPVEPENELIKNVRSEKSRKQTLEELVDMSCHYNGFKRESAVRALGNMGDPRALSALLVRVNDWVSEVREVAKESFIKLLTTQNINSVIDHLPQIYHLLKCGRTEHGALIEKVDGYLIEQRSSDFLIQGINSPEKLVARACFNLVIKNKLLLEHELVELGLKNKDVIIRLKCADLLRYVPLSVRTPLLKIAIKDKFMPIRREAFQTQLKINDLNNEELAKSFLFDRHSAIREIAINFLKLKKINISKIYLDAMESSKIASINCAIWGIGHLLLKEHVGKVESKLNNCSFPRVRKQALTTLYQLSYDFMKTILLKSLFDESPSVCKNAARLLSKSEFALTLTDISSIMKKASSTQLYSICFSLSRHINKWDRLIFIINCHSLNLEKIESELLQKEYVHWNQGFNNSGTQPSKEQLLKLYYHYKTDQKFIGTNLLNLLSFTLRTNGLKLDN